MYGRLFITSLESVALHFFVLLPFPENKKINKKKNKKKKMVSTTSASVIKVFSGWFNTLGWPSVIRTDGGPQFRTEFSQFCDKNGIKHDLASPYNPRANGLAENGVKVVKGLLLKCIGEEGDMQRVLYEWRNMPKSHGFSPAQLLFGRSQNMLIPQPPAAFIPIDFSEAALARDQLFNSQAGPYNRDKVNLEQLSHGQLVRVQNESTGLWDLTGTVTDIRPDGFSYMIDIDGRSFIRGRPKLKPVFKARSPEVGVSESESSPGVGVISVNKDSSSFADCSIPTLRRSDRIQERCATGSLSSSVCGLSSGTGVQHTPFSYSVPCPALVVPAEARPTRKNSKNSERWQSCTGTIPKKIPSTSQIPGYPCSISSGQASPAERQPWELLQSSAAPLSSVAYGRQRQEEGDAKIRSAYSRQSTQLAPQLMTSPPPLPRGPVSLPQLPPPLPDQTGSGRPLDGRVFPHHTLMDPLGFQGSRSPNSRHYYTTGISTGVDTLLAAKPLKCGPFQPSHPLRHHVPIHRIAGRGRQGQEVLQAFPPSLTRKEGISALFSLCANQFCPDISLRLPGKTGLPDRGPALRKLVYIPRFCRRKA